MCYVWGWNPFLSWWDEKPSFHTSLCRTRNHPCLRAGRKERRARKLHSFKDVTTLTGRRASIEADEREKPLMIRKLTAELNNLNADLERNSTGKLLLRFWTALPYQGHKCKPWSELWNQWSVLSSILSFLGKTRSTLCMEAWRTQKLWVKELVWRENLEEWQEAKFWGKNPS